MIDHSRLYRRVILAGAGLSRNWGGYLASEMWGTILTHPSIRRIPELRALLLNQPDFEAALGEVRSNFGAVAQQVLEEAVKQAYALHEQNLCRGLDKREGRAAWLDFSEVVIPLATRPTGDTSFLFTLNQDLLMERVFQRPVPEPPQLPGVVPDDPNAWFPKLKEEWQLAPEPAGRYRGRLKSSSLQPDDFHGKFNYVKLHGSFNWYTDEESRTNVMVIGTNKNDTIERFPALASYHRVFRDVLTAGGVRLLSVGYSFSDKHINSVIGDAIDSHDLELVIADVRAPADARKVLDKADPRLWKGVTGYFSRPISETFGTSETSTIRGGESQRMGSALHN